jgi:hypothetical protein
MKTDDILDRVEVIVNQELERSKPLTRDSEDDTEKKSVFEALNLLLLYVVRTVKTPIKIVSKFIKEEILPSMEKDFKLYLLIMGSVMLLALFFGVIWVSIAIAVGVFFFDIGYSVLESVLFSLGFQVLSFLLLSLIAFIASKNIKSLQLLKRANEYRKTNLEG